MTIFPVQWDAQDKPMLYRSSQVYTTVGGKSMWVSAGYEAESIAKICVMAFGNALVRHMVARLADKKAWRMSSI